jgi:hypothetical protein
VAKKGEALGAAISLLVQGSGMGEPQNLSTARLYTL